MDVSIKCPFVMQVCGPSQSGKSEWVGKLISQHEELLEKKIDKVYWHSPHGNLPESLAKYKNIVVKKHLPWAKRKQLDCDDDKDDDDDDSDDDDSDDEGTRKHRLMVIDDFAGEVKNSSEMTELFTRGSHHRGISVVQITQNLFWKSSDARTRTLNVHYLVLMRQTRDLQQIRLLGRQAAQSPGDQAAVMDAYKDATSQRNYSYLLISFHPRDTRALMLRTNIFANESPSNIIYALPSEKKEYKRLMVVENSERNDKESNTTHFKK